MNFVNLFVIVLVVCFFVNCMYPDSNPYRRISWEKLANPDSVWTCYDTNSTVPLTALKLKDIKGEWLAYTVCVSPIKEESSKVCHTGMYEYRCLNWNKEGVAKNGSDSGVVYTLTSNILRTSNWDHPCDTLFINMVKKDSLITTIKMHPECPEGRYWYERHYYKRKKWYLRKS